VFKSEQGLLIPDEAVKYIRWQRSRFIVAKVPDPEEVKRRYAAWVAEDFAGMEPHLPERVESIIEIGCGLAAIEVFLKRRYPGARLSLLDDTGENISAAGSDRETGVGGWQDTLHPYNSRAQTEALLAVNGVRVDRWIDIGTKEPLKADLIFSLASWGYHYPFTTYSVEGLVICDLRRAHERTRIKAIQSLGGKIIFAGPKYDRCMFEWVS
jgi:hypothetical protein